MSGRSWREIMKKGNVEQVVEKIVVVQRVLNLTQDGDAGGLEELHEKEGWAESCGDGRTGLHLPVPGPFDTLCSH